MDTLRVLFRKRRIPWQESWKQLRKCFGNCLSAFLNREAIITKLASGIGNDLLVDCWEDVMDCFACAVTDKLRKMRKVETPCLCTSSYLTTNGS